MASTAARASGRRCVERTLDPQVMGDAEEELDRGLLIGIPVALGVLAIPLGEVAVVVEYRRRNDELRFPHEGIAVFVDGQVHEPQPEAPQLAFQTVEGSTVRAGGSAR